MNYSRLIVDFTITTQVAIYYRHSTPLECKSLKYAIFYRHITPESTEFPEAIA